MQYVTTYTLSEVFGDGDLIHFLIYISVWFLAPPTPDISLIPNFPNGRYFIDWLQSKFVFVFQVLSVSITKLMQKLIAFPPPLLMCMQWRMHEDVHSHKKVCTFPSMFFLLKFKTETIGQKSLVGVSQARSNDVYEFYLNLFI